MDKPRTKGQLYRYIADTIEQEGFHYTFVDYMSPDNVNCEDIDPELAAMWREYEALVRKISEHIGVS